MKRYNDYNPQISDPDTIVENNTSENIDVADDNRKVKSNSGNKQSKPKAIKAPKAWQSTLDFLNSPTLRYLIGLISIALGAYLIISFFSFLKEGFADQSEIKLAEMATVDAVKNKGGEGGARLSQFLINDCFGIASIALIFWLIALSVKMFAQKAKFKFLDFTIKCIIALVSISLIAGTLSLNLSSHFNWGGNHGKEVNAFLAQFLGDYGSIVLCIFSVGLLAIVCLNDIRKWVGKINAARAKRREEAFALQEEERLKEEERAAMSVLSDESQEADIESDGTDDESSNVEFDEDIDMPEQFDDDASLTYDDNHDDEDVEDDQSFDDDHQTDMTYDYSGEDDEDSVSDPMKDAMVVNVNQIEEGDTKGMPAFYDPTADLSRYKFPKYNLLKQFESKISVDEEEQLNNKELIRKTLLDFGIPITSIKATIGPTVTLYEVIPESGIKISKIRSLVDDIALSLAAVGVRIIAPIPGKGTVGIEVANKDPQTVSMRTILTSKKFQENKYELPIAIGSTISNEVCMADLAKMPHLLVAGATGQGKSVGLNAIITSLLYSKHPAELKFVLVDPKMVEFSLYSKLEKHYLAKIPDSDNAIITDPSKVVATLTSLCQEMDNRLTLLSDCQTRTIVEYNQKFKNRQLNPHKGHRYLPYIVVVIDEFCDLIMMAGKEIETPIMRIAQKARAVGIHMIIATQRPSTTVITGNIKANIPARIAFRVSSGIDSRTILDAVGAQQLIGRGDMLLSNGSEMIRVQCAFIDTPEVEAICDYIGSQQGYSDAYLLPEPIIESSSNDKGGDGFLSGDRDELFEEIARMVVSSNTASTSSLQRRYNIGYNRAGRIMDQLCDAGIVGPAQGGKPRSVLVDAIGLESILNSL